MPQNLIFPNSVYHNSVCPYAGDVFGICDSSVYIDSEGEEAFIPFVDDAPATGAIKLVNDGLMTNVFGTDVNLIDGKARIFSSKSAMITNVEANPMIYELGKSGDGSQSLRIVYDSTGGSGGTGGYRAFLVGTGGSVAIVTLYITMPREDLETWELEVGTSLVLTINGVSTTPAAINLTSCFVNTETLASRVDLSFKAPMDVSWLDSAVTGYTNFVGSLPGQNDIVNGNKFYSDGVGNEDGAPSVGVAATWTATDNNPKGMYFPHDLDGEPTDWPTTYLKEDRYLIDGTCVIVPAGQEVPSIGGDFTEEFTYEFL